MFLALRSEHPLPVVVRHYTPHPPMKRMSNSIGTTMRHPHAQLPQKFFGRCAQTKWVTNVAPKTIKVDPTKGYEPPNEATTNKARLKARQTRRLISLIRHIQKLSLHHLNNLQQRQLQQEWEAIVRAQGYGRSWCAWILSFECISFVPQAVPAVTWLTDAYHITKLDADTYF